MMLMRSNKSGYGAEMLGEFGGMTSAALAGGAAEAVAGRTSIYKYEAGNLPGNFRTGNSFAGSPQNMTDAQRNADISEICSELRDFSVNQVVTSPNAINSFTRRAETRLHDLAVEIEGKYPGDGQAAHPLFMYRTLKGGYWRAQLLSHLQGCRMEVFGEHPAEQLVVGKSVALQNALQRVLR